MAIQKEDKKTRQLEGIPKKRGRPRTGNAKSNAERQAEFRTRQSQEREAALDAVAGAYAETSTEDVRQMIATGGPVTMESAWRELGRRMGWLL